MTALSRQTDGTGREAPIGRGKVIRLLDTKTDEMIEAQTGTQVSSGSRGGFDPQGNAWFGGRGGMLLKLDAKTHRVTQYFPPIQYDTFYEAMPDKNGDVWAGGLESGHFMRFNQKTEQWTSYMLPEPYAHDRRTWIDNSTDPVSVWVMWIMKDTWSAFSRWIKGCGKIKFARHVLNGVARTIPIFPSPKPVLILRFHAFLSRRSLWRHILFLVGHG